MKQTQIKFVGPKVVCISEVMETPNKVEELIVTLNYPVWGDVMVKIWKSGNTYKYYDQDSPIKTRTFDSITSLMWEYELPEVLKSYIEKL
jgi:hypothetical protein